jgi:alpha-amylase
MKQPNRTPTLVVTMLVVLGFGVLTPRPLWANPWNGKVVLQAFWWDAWNESYRQDWYTYLAKLAPRLRELGFDGIWIPSPAKGNSGTNSMGYDIFDHYDLGDKDQKGTVATRFGSKDSLLRLVAVSHANGLEVYPDIVLNHISGGEEDPQAPGDKFKKFRYVGFSGPDSGRWAKDHWNFHPNPDHQCTAGDICEQSFGPDVCYLDADHGGGGNGKYMRDRAREWFVWLTKQIGADGFRFDAVKHYEAYVVEDLLYNAMGDRLDYFAVGEYVGSQQQLDAWVDQVQNRSGTFDFPLREALAQVVDGSGFFDMGSLPNAQQKNRLKTVPFVNNHDTWRGAYWDSEPGSLSHDDRSGDWRQNREELALTIDPDNPRADVAYAAAFAVDGSPMVFYEDLFVNHGPDRFKADPQTIRTRDYLVNLIWAHQKLNFKDGAYKVRYRESPDLLVIERSGKALIGLNDHGNEWREAWVHTDFGPHTKLHDYSGANADDLETDTNGLVRVAVPPMGYAVWGPVGLGGGFTPQRRRTTQEFQLDDDLGDARSPSPRYGGKLNAGEWRSGGAVWTADQSMVKVWVYTDGKRDVELRVYKPDAHGQKSRDQGQFSIVGEASNDRPLYLEFQADVEGYHQLAAKITHSDQPPTRAYLKVEYIAPPTSNKF